MRRTCPGGIDFVGRRNLDGAGLSIFEDEFTVHESDIRTNPAV